MAADRDKRAAARIAAIENAASVGKGPVRRPLRTLQGRKLATLPDKVKPALPSWQTGKSTAQRGYGGRWQREREAWLSTPGQTHCVTCGAVGKVVDHIERHTGPDDPRFWDKRNWQTLCLSCHNRKTGKEGH